MKSVLFIYPHQLFETKDFPEVDSIYVIEEPLLFGSDEQYQMHFHKAKLVLMRAATRRYVEEVLWPSGKAVEYFSNESTSWTGQPVVKAIENGFTKIYVFDTCDDILWKRITETAKEQTVAAEVVKLPTPNFYLQQKDIEQFFGGKSTHKFADFYQWQRERFNVLIDDDYRPAGGKWSYDGEPAHKLDPNAQLPGVRSFGDNKYVAEAIDYVSSHFPDNPGSVENFIWPTNHEEASQWLDEFLKQKLGDFGAYQDAITNRGIWLYHSLLSSSLNIGLLSSRQVIDAALAYGEKNKTPLPSLESFVRQVLGWREYVRALYVNQNTPMRRSNVFKNERKLTQAWYDGTTGILPIDDVIKKVQTHAYAHHAERLMVIGNLMLLCEIHPDEVYKWFMTFFIDAYDWVVVPNVYGMSQFSDGGSMAAKPYIAPSSYILDMSDYVRDDWCDIWDGLYWRFVDKHRTLLQKNPRVGGVLVKRFDSMDEARKRIIGYRADDFLAQHTA